MNENLFDILKLKDEKDVPSKLISHCWLEYKRKVNPRSIDSFRKKWAVLRAFGACFM